VCLSSIYRFVNLHWFFALFEVAHWFFALFEVAQWFFALFKVAQAIRQRLAACPF
jgi:hypothetical protein